MFQEDRLFWSFFQPHLASENVGKVGGCAVVQREKFETAMSRCPKQGHPSKVLGKEKQLWSDWKKTSSEEKYSAEE